MPRSNTFWTRTLWTTVSRIMRQYGSSCAARLYCPCQPSADSAADVQRFSFFRHRCTVCLSHGPRGGGASETLQDYWCWLCVKQRSLFVRFCQRHRPHRQRTRSPNTLVRFFRVHRSRSFAARLFDFRSSKTEVRLRSILRPPRPLHCSAPYGTRKAPSRKAYLPRLYRGD